MMAQQGLCPCLCGCPAHQRAVCLDCGCGVYAPDYVAGAKLEGEVLTKEREATLKAWSRDVAEQLGHTGRPRPGVTGDDNRIQRKCDYCRGLYRVGRSHSRTCSGACRQAVSVALAYDDDVDVPGPLLRHVVFSKERARATSYGTMTASAACRADLRIRRWARIFRVKPE